MTDPLQIPHRLNHSGVPTMPVVLPFPSRRHSAQTPCFSSPPSLRQPRPRPARLNDWLAMLDHLQILALRNPDKFAGVGEVAGLMAAEELQPQTLASSVDVDPAGVL